MGQEPIPWREDQARGPGCSNCEDPAAPQGEPVPAPERASREARNSRRLRPQGQALPPPGGGRVTAPLRRGAPACPRPGPPPATARPGPKPGPRGRSLARRCPLREQDGGGRRSGVGAGPPRLGTPGFRRVAGKAPRGTPRPSPTFASGVASPPRLGLGGAEAVTRGRGREAGQRRETGAL